MRDIELLMVEWAELRSTPGSRYLPDTEALVERLIAVTRGERIENDGLRAVLRQQRDYLRRLKHRAKVRGGPDTAAMAIADEADGHIRDVLGVIDR